MTGFVYKWIDSSNDMYYIGSHKGTVDDGYIGSGVHFNRAYSKRPEMFSREILYTGEHYLELEEFILEELDAANDNMSYNLKNTAIGGWLHTHKNKDVRNKRAAAISKSKKGKTYDFMFYDKSGENNPMYGKKHSLDAKKKIAKSRIGVCQNNVKKEVLELTSMMVFDSVAEAAKHYGVSASTMSVLVRNEIIKRGKCKNKRFVYVSHS
jgi:hypothetical protein